MVRLFLSMMSSVTVVKTDECGQRGFGWNSKQWHIVDGTHNACDCQRGCCGLSGVSGYTRTGQGVCFCQKDARPSMSSCSDCVSDTCGFLVENEVNGCVAHPSQPSHPLDRCSSDSDPAGCTGGLDAANCYCNHKYGPGSWAMTHSTHGHKDHTWSCAKNHENFCMGGCDCIDSVRCVVPQVKTAQFCAMVIANCPGKTDHYYKVTYKVGYSQTREHSKEVRQSLQMSLSGGFEGKLPEAAGDIGIHGESASAFSNNVMESWSQIDTKEQEITLEQGGTCDKEKYLYYGQTKVIMTDNSEVTLSSGNFWLSLKSLGQGIAVCTNPIAASGPGRLTAQNISRSDVLETIV